jgi:hypothetical protein
MQIIERIANFYKVEARVKKHVYLEENRKIERLQETLSIEAVVKILISGIDLSLPRILRVLWNSGFRSSKS